ncbi:MAG TPA: sulfatase-like hydrolase/transferase [Planctomycetaceae bacterium]|nr:sulfatase-like hydrolase/transferase [Planctomycetaceae bacterium]
MGRRGFWLTFAFLFIAPMWAAETPARPNILWISCEDTSPDLGCYGDAYAVTPNIDRLATEGVRYTRCFTHAGVCAPSRSGIITGCYPPSIGTHHMRCKGVPPAEVRCFTESLRAAGYYCTNNVKTDYQFEPPPTAWDENSNKADWRGRKDGQPFFCVINFTTSHESQVRDPSPSTQKLIAALPASSRHDPAKAPIWPFYPDNPVVRRDVANYYDIVSAMDTQVGEVLKQLEADGLADDTIVWFWGDHGRGLSRCKRWLYDSGTNAPLVIRTPEKWRRDGAAPGAVNRDLVAFVDFAPTVLSLAGVTIPAHFQGQSFLGPKAVEPRQYVYGHRDRMDETYDLIRMVRDARFKYLRNFRHDLSYAQNISYMNQMPMMQEMRRLNAAGELTNGPAQYFRPTKPLEELFDTETDPHELNNLANDERYRDILLRMRAECERWMRSTGDVGLVPEAIFDSLKRPGDEYEVTDAPSVSEALDPQHADQLRITLQAATPGSSLQFVRLPRQDAPIGKGDWELYVEPFSAKTGEAIAVQANRIGFNPSKPLRWTVGTPPTAIEREIVSRPHWRETLQKTGALDRLLALRQSDFLPLEERRAAYRRALQDDHPAMRYWGVWAWTQAPEMRDIAAVADRLRSLAASDPDPQVRVIAARGLAMASNDPAPVEQLVKVAETDPLATVRLAAVTALQELGEKARPFENRLRPSPDDSEYVGRIKQAILKQWK